MSHAGQLLVCKGTAVTATLWAYVIGNRCVWAIPTVSDVFPYQPSLLVTLTVEVKFLLRHLVFYQALEHPKPLKDIH